MRFRKPPKAYQNMGNGLARTRKYVLANVHNQDQLDAFLSKLNPDGLDQKFEVIRPWLPFDGVNQISPMLQTGAEEVSQNNST